MNRIPNNETGYSNQRAFKEYLREFKRLKESTIESYDTTVYYFFCFRMEITLDYDPSFAAEETVVNDVKKYLEHLLIDKKYSISTHNKQLTALRSYFMYLYSQRIIRNYPVVDLKNLRIPEVKTQPEDKSDRFDAWIDDMPKHLQNKEVSLIARVLLLFISKGYGISKQMERGFYKRLKHIELNEIEQEILDEYLKNIRPLQTLYGTQEIYIKHRKRENNTTDDFMYGRRQLYYFLKEADKALELTVVPSTLVYQARLRFIRDHPDMNEIELMDALEINYPMMTKLKEESKRVYSTEKEEEPSTL